MPILASVKLGKDPKFVNAKHSFFAIGIAIGIVLAENIRKKVGAVH